MQIQIAKHLNSESNIQQRLIKKQYASNISFKANSDFFIKNEPVKANSNPLLWLLGVIVTSFIVKNLHKLLNTPPKAFIEIIDGKNKLLQTLIDNADKVFSEKIQGSTKNIKAFFAKASVDEKELEEINKVCGLINSSKSKKELIKNEEKAFEKLNKWFMENYDKGKKPQEEYQRFFNDTYNDLLNDLNAKCNNFHEQITQISEIPEKYMSKRSCKKAIESFNQDIEEIKKHLVNKKDAGLINFKNESKKSFYDVNHYSSKITETKNSITSEIIKKVETKSKEFVTDIPEKSSGTWVNPGSDIVPANLSSVIYKNVFYQLILNNSRGSKELCDIQNLITEKNNFQDFLTLIKRIDLRRNLDADNAQSLHWYDNTINKLESFKNYALKIVEDSLLKASKDYKINSILLPEQEENILFSLQNSAKKMGYSSTEKFVKDLILTDISLDIEDAESIIYTTEFKPVALIRKIYPKIEDKLKDM